MKFITLPQMPNPVSRIVLGTAWFGTNIAEDQAFGLMDRYAGCGGNLLDSAHMYASWMPGGAGKSETTVGRWLKRTNPDGMLIATKGADRGMTREGIRQQLNESLERLDRARIDFYWLHSDDPKIPAGEILEWLNELVKEGIFPAFGCSNWRVPRIIEAAEYARAHKVQGFSASQISWSLAMAIPEIASTLPQVFMDEDTLEFHRRQAFPIVAYSSQAGGFFAGNYDPDGPTAGGQPNPNIVRLFGSKMNYARLAAAKDIATAKGCSVNQVSLAWMLHQSFPACAIVGANSPERVADSCGAADVDLTPEEIRRLECSA